MVKEAALPKSIWHNFYNTPTKGSEASYLEKISNANQFANCSESTLERSRGGQTLIKNCQRRRSKE